MNFDTGLLLEHINVPFVPTLGVVHPCALSASVAGILNFAHEGEFLPYDKEKRWGGVKRERLLKEHMFQNENCTIIPASHNNTLIRLYCYGAANALGEQRDRLKKFYPDAKFQAVLFGTDEGFKSDSIVFLANKGFHAPSAKMDVVPLKSLPPHIAKTIGILAKDDADNSGFQFLQERLAQGYNNGEFFVAVENNTISGAVGPLQTMTDAAGQLTRYPVYFGVLKNTRGKGLGTALWSAAINWAEKEGIQHIILQARTDSPAEHFYRRMGLKALGGVARINLD